MESENFLDFRANPLTLGEVYSLLESIKGQELCNTQAVISNATTAGSSANFTPVMKSPLPQLHANDVDDYFKSIKMKAPNTALNAPMPAAENLHAPMPAENLNAPMPDETFHAQMPTETLHAPMPDETVYAPMSGEIFHAQMPSERLHAPMPTAENLNAPMPDETFHAQMPTETLHAPMHASMPDETVYAPLAGETFHAQMPSERLHAPMPPAENLNAPMPDETFHAQMPTGTPMHQCMHQMRPSMHQCHAQMISERLSPCTKPQCTNARCIDATHTCHMRPTMHKYAPMPPAERPQCTNATRCLPCTNAI